MNDAFHKSVLLDETVNALNVQIGKNYIDATLGAAGHSLEIIRRGGVVLGIDQDEDAIAYAKSRVQSLEFRIEEDAVIVCGNFRDVDRIARENGFEKVAGILFDLGVSSHQFDTKERGFSFQKEGPLDMRMNQGLTVTAANLVNGLTEKELNELFVKFGEEPKARLIAKEIVKRRLENPITTTEDLTTIIEQFYGKGFRSEKERAKASMRVFQALRIAVNDELSSLEEALPKALELLENGGRLAVISFHSLEDRIVKHMFVTFEKNNMGKIITKKPITASTPEIQENRKARSAKLRVFEKAF